MVMSRGLAAKQYSSYMMSLEGIYGMSGSIQEGVMENGCRHECIMVT